VSDIDRVYAHINGFFEAGGRAEVEGLIKVLDHHMFCAQNSYAESEMEDDERKKLLDQTRDAIKNIEVDKLPDDIDALKTTFCDLANDVMVARRAVLPLDKGVDPKVALFNEDDMYSFAVYDTLADQIAPLLPALHQIAAESSWDPKHRAGA